MRQVLKESERQWGTVREDYSANGDAWGYLTHEQAQARTYRWGEDGLLGLCDNRGLVNFAVALWNGNDPGTRVGLDHLGDHVPCDERRPREVDTDDRVPLLLAEQLELAGLPVLLHEQAVTQDTGVVDERLMTGDSAASTIHRLLTAPVPPVSSLRHGVKNVRFPAAVWSHHNGNPRARDRHLGAIAKALESEDMNLL